MLLELERGCRNKVDGLRYVAPGGHVSAVRKNCRNRQSARKFVKRLVYLILACVLAGCSPGGDGVETSEPGAARNEAAEATDNRSAGAASTDTDSSAIRVVLLGDSITAGLGVDPDSAYPALLQDRIDRAGLEARIVDAGISGDTSTGGLNRIDWLLEDGIDVLVIELGGNDGLRGIDPELTKRNLAAIIERTRAEAPGARIILAGMMVPPNLGQEYTERFRRMYPELADEYDTELIPFILEGVGGVDSMMQSDGIHPNTPGHARTAENVWDVLEPVLRENAES